MTRTIHVRVVAIFGLVFHVRNGDGDAPLLFLGGLIDHVERNIIRKPLFGQNLRDGGRQGGLPMVDVTDGSNI